MSDNASPLSLHAQPPSRVSFMTRLYVGMDEGGAYVTDQRAESNAFIVEESPGVFVMDDGVDEGMTVARLPNARAVAY